MKRATSESQERQILAFGAACGTAACLLCLPFLGIGSLSALIGAALALGNFWLLARTVHALLRTKALASYGLLVLVKVTVIGAALYALLASDWISELPFVLGLGALPLGIALSQLFGASPAASEGENEGSHA